MPQEHFWHVGPNGRHLCIVMPVLGPSVAGAKALEDVDFLKDVCSGIARGLAFLHSKGMAHGDLHQGNILLQTTVSKLSVDGINSFMENNNHDDPLAAGYDWPGPWAPRTLYKCLNWTKVDPKLVKKEIAIIDFGKSFMAKDPPSHPTIHYPLRAPEQFFNIPPTQASDLWTLGCTLMHILGSRNPFKTLPEHQPWPPIPWWEDALGPLPQPYRDWFIASQEPTERRKYDKINSSEPVSPSEQLARAKNRRREESGTEDVVFALLAMPSSIPVLPSE